MRGVCNCITGPPPGGDCGACGALGAGWTPGQAPRPQNVPGSYTTPAPLTEDDVRRIFREEFERARKASSAGLFESTEAPS